MLFFKAHVTGGPTSVALGKNAHTGARIPCEGDIRGLSPSLAESLQLVRSVRGLCARHRSSLGVPLGQGAEGDLELDGKGVSNRDGRDGQGKDVGEGGDGGKARDMQLWVNDQLSNVSTSGICSWFVLRRGWKANSQSRVCRDKIFENTGLLAIMKFTCGEKHQQKGGVWEMETGVSPEDAVILHG